MEIVFRTDSHARAIHERPHLVAIHTQHSIMFQYGFVIGANGAILVLCYRTIDWPVRYRIERDNEEEAAPSLT